MRPHITALRELKRVVEAAPDDLFHMRFWENEESCGTVRCAGGWACADPWFQSRGLSLNHPRGYPMFKFWRSLEALAHFFRLPDRTADHLFAGSLYFSNPHAISKRQVLNQIDRILAGQPTKPYRIYERRAP